LVLVHHRDLGSFVTVPNVENDGAEDSSGGGGEKGASCDEELRDEEALEEEGVELVDEDGREMRREGEETRMCEWWSWERESDMEDVAPGASSRRASSSISSERT
jgi:hypothetical protein